MPLFFYQLTFTTMSAQSFYIVTYRDSFHGFRSITFNNLHSAVAFSESLIGEGCGYIMLEHTFRKPLRFIENQQIVIDEIPV